MKMVLLFAVAALAAGCLGDVKSPPCHQVPETVRGTTSALFYGHVTALGSDRALKGVTVRVEPLESYKDIGAREGGTVSDTEGCYGAHVEPPERNQRIATYEISFLVDGFHYLDRSAGVIKAGELRRIDAQLVPEPPPSPSP